MEIWHVKAANEDKHDMGVYITSEKRKWSESMDIYHWPKFLLNEIESFQFHGILEHTAFHAKGNNILLHSLLKAFHMF